MEITSSSISSAQNPKESNSVKLNTFGEEFEALLNYTPTKDIDKIYENISYEETKSMTDTQIEDMYSNLQDEEIKHIKYMREIANSFSHSDEANKAIFEETKNIKGDKERLQFSLELFWTKIRSASKSSPDDIEVQNDNKSKPMIEELGYISFDTPEAYEKYLKDVENDMVTMNEGRELDKHRVGKYSDHRLSEEDAVAYMEKMLQDSISKHDKSNHENEKVNLRKDIAMYTRILHTYINEIENKKDKENQAILEQYTRNNKPNVLDEKRVEA